MQLTSPAHRPRASPREDRLSPKLAIAWTLQFLRYWQANGSLPVFGLPGQPGAAKQRGRCFSGWNAAVSSCILRTQLLYTVLLGRLGIEVLQRQGRDWQTFPKADPSAAHYFRETGQAIAPQFWEYWRTHGLEFDGRRGTSFAESLALFGYPISAAQQGNEARMGTSC